MPLSVSGVVTVVAGEVGRGVGVPAGGDAGVAGSLSVRGAATAGSAGLGTVPGVLEGTDPPVIPAEPITGGFVP
jgi:hypothetical protein